MLLIPELPTAFQGLDFATGAEKKKNARSQSGRLILVIPTLEEKRDLRMSSRQT
jgi:hypothetical protein